MSSIEHLIRRQEQLSMSRLNQLRTVLSMKYHSSSEVSSIRMNLIKIIRW